MTASEQQSVPRGGSGAMFDGIAGRYDLLNRIISLGIDQSWRRKTVDALAVPTGGRVLDLATGTADLAILIAERTKAASIVGVDPSTGMLDVGKGKIAAKQLTSRVSLEVGDAERIEAESASFDGVSIAFGIRNVPDRARALREMARVTKPGGRVAILELSEPRGGVLGPLARFHIHTVVPTIGALLSGSREYGYLQASIANFPPADAFRALMEASGLRVIEIVPLTFGVAHLYIATPAADGPATGTGGVA